jgi:hypothetical protein
MATARKKAKYAAASSGHINLKQSIFSFDNWLKLSFNFFPVLTRCQFSGIPALTLASYTDSENPDSITLSGFRILFQFPEVGTMLGQVEAGEVKDRLKRLSAAQQKNNLFV